MKGQLDTLFLLRWGAHSPPALLEIATAALANYVQRFANAQNNTWRK